MGKDRERKIGKIEKKIGKEKRRERRKKKTKKTRFLGRAFLRAFCYKSAADTLLLLATAIARFFSKYSRTSTSISAKSASSLKAVNRL